MITPLLLTVLTASVPADTPKDLNPVTIKGTPKHAPVPLRRHPLGRVRVPRALRRGPVVLPRRPGPIRAEDAHADRPADLAGGRAGVSPARELAADVGPLARQGNRPGAAAHLPPGRQL